MSRFRFKPKKHAPECSSNGTRANNAAIVLCSEERPYDIEGEITATGISDLMADLLHLCDREGIDGEGLLARAATNWRAER